MAGYADDIESLTRSNSFFRHVVHTSKQLQLVLMSLLPGEEIGSEIHADTDQFFRFESGAGNVVINGENHEVHDGMGVIVPAGATHNVINTSPDAPLKLYTIYSPPHHKDGTVHKTRQEALKSES